MNSSSNMAFLTPHGSKISEATLKAALHEAVPGKEEQVMTLFVEEWKQRGLQEGLTNLMLKQLKRQIGEVDVETRERIKALAPTQLEALGEALLDFHSAADLAAWLKNTIQPANQHN